MSGATPPAQDTGSAALGRLECDAFCSCGYNLFRQEVVRDERLDLPLVRCPECGKWHPAGHGATAASVWMTRLARVLLVAWMILLLLAAGLIVLVQLGFNLYAHEQVFNVNAYYYRQEEGWGRYLFLLFPLGLGMFAGLVQAVSMWHLHPVARLVPMVIVLGAAWMLSIATTQGYPTVYREMAIFTFAATSGVTACGWFITVAGGRRPALWLGRLLIPPGARQYVQVLWEPRN